MAIEYIPISGLDEQLVQRAQDHMVSVDMSEANINDRTKRVYPQNLNVPNIKYVVTQAGHPFGVLSPVYYDTVLKIWQLAKADSLSTICTHVVGWVGGDEFILIEQGVVALVHGLDVGYWWLSDTTAGELVDAAPAIKNPVLLVLDANTLQVLDKVIDSNIILVEELDRISDRVKAIEDNLPPTIDIDSEVTETGTNPVEGKGIFAALQLLWQAVQQAFTDLFIPTKTSDLQNDSNFITSSSLTKANIKGLKDTDSPTFADTLIPALADPASYDPATVAYLTELFGELSDSVKESILRTWGRLQDITNKVAGLQLQSGGKVNALGSITGLNEIDLSDGTFVTATLTGAIQLAFTGLPTAGYVKDFVLLFTNIETITFPVDTKFAGGVPPVVIASPYMFVCSVDSGGGVTVYSLVDNIIVPV